MPLLHPCIGDVQTATFIAGISGTTVTGTAVVVNLASGQLGVAPCSARFKEVIKPMDKASQAILALKPVTFHYKKNIDPQGTSQFGLVAEDVESVNPNLVVRDKEGKPYTVRYDAVNAMLLNEFLKEHEKVQEQEGAIAQLKQDSAEQRKQIERLTAGLQKVNAQRANRRKWSTIPKPRPALTKQQHFTISRHALQRIPTADPVSRGTQSA